MMRAVRKSTLFVAFYLLTSAATAYAECAWVLWKDTTDYETVTVPMSAFGTKQACERALGEQLAKWRTGDTNLKATVRDTTVFVETKDGRSMTTAVHYICFPDTVDPRGSKGK